jgi:transcriptional regulator with XRE-family HTH domain
MPGCLPASASKGSLPGTLKGPCVQNPEASRDVPMSDDTSNPALHFGHELQCARLAAGMTLAQVARVIGYHKSQVSRVERGLRAPTEKFAKGCDTAFPLRGGWFLRFYKDSRRWSAMPPWFRPWIEHELRAVNLRIWQPSSLSGLLQTEAYALAQLRTFTGVTAEQVAERLAARLARQAILTRETPAPPMVLFLVDESALRRFTGSALIMADQLERLLALAALPNVTIQVVPNVMHAETTGGFALAEAPRGPAAYIETALTGQVFEDINVILDLSARFDALRTEALRGTESLRLIEEVATEWRQQATGARPATQARTAASA